MSFFNRFFNLFHRKHRFTPEYSTLSFLKKVIFFGMTGFIFSLGASKFIFSKLIFSFEPTDENRLYIKLNPALERGTYYPSMLMVLGIFQRLYANYREEQPYLRMQEEQFQGDTLHWVVLHDKAYHFSKKKKQLIPLVLVIAGSEGIDNTVRQLLLTSYNLGYRVVALDPKDLYDVKQINKIVEHLKEKYPKSEVLGIGVEYGANLLVNFEGQHPKSLAGLVSIGNPFDLIKSQINLQDSWLWRPLYNAMLTGKLKKAQLINKNIESNKEISLFQLEKYVYKIEDQKYQEWKQQNSSINSIKNLQIPSFFLQSKEDPFTQQISVDERFQNEKCIYVTTQRGGHNEWFENLWMNRWFTSPVRSFLKLVHEKKVEQIQGSNKPTQAKE